MQSMTIRLPDELMDWLKQQAELNDRSCNKEIKRLIEEAIAKKGSVSNAKKALGIKQ